MAKKDSQTALKKGTPRYAACVSIFGKAHCDKLLSMAGDKATDTKSTADRYFCQPCTDEADQHATKMAVGVASWFSSTGTDKAIKEADAKRKKLLIGFASYWELPT